MKNIVICFDVLQDYSLGGYTTNCLRLFYTLTSGESQSKLYIPLPPYESSSAGLGEALVKGLEAAVKIEPLSVISALISPALKSEEWQRIKSYAFGDAMPKQILAAVQYLGKIFTDGDRLFVFGSGAAGTAATLFAGYIQTFGLVNEASGISVADSVKRYLRSTLGNRALDARFFKAAFARPCELAFLGLWDCLEEPTLLHSPARILSSALPLAAQIRHAVAIDERRVAYIPYLFDTDKSLDYGNRLKEVWFAGVHSDVIGSYIEAESGLSKIALEWMLQEASASELLIDNRKAGTILGKDEQTEGPQPFAKPDPHGTLHESLRGPWWELEVIPRRTWDRMTGTRRWTAHLGERRAIPYGALLHPTVYLRLAGATEYRPANIPKDHRMVS